MFSQPDNLDLRFRPRGAGRFVGAGFLLVWLCGWAAGELFALAMLFGGLIALVTGQPPLGGKEPLQLGPALAVGAFLLVWVSFWTFGGIMAMRELLRMLWAEDHLVLSPGNLSLTRRLGPFSKTRQLAPADIQRVYLQLPSSVLVAQIGADSVELTNLGTLAERTEAAGQLRAALSLPADVENAGATALPKGWEEVFTPRGETVLTSDLKTRHKQALIVTGIALVAWAGLFLLLWESLRAPNLWGLTAMAAALVVWLSWGSYRLHRTRKEWRLERGRLTLQRRTGWQVIELAEARGLELIETHDSDGDRTYELRALETADAAFRRGKPARHFTIHRVIHDPTEPRGLGRWLAQRAEIPLDDQIPTDSAREAEWRQLRDWLANSGKLGRIAARFLDSTKNRRGPRSATGRRK